MATYRPIDIGVWALANRSSTSCKDVSNASVPPAGMASRAFSARFKITCSICPGSAETVQPPVLYVSSSSDLELLPRDVARLKVQCLGGAVRRLTQPVAP